MNYPKKELAQLIVEYCSAYEIEDVVISPGSRNAPLTIGFVNHPKIRTYSIVDERCAGFFALGISQQKRKPVCVVCTSGSAVLNYYPAVAEAFYSNIPLIVISADRPRIKIDIGDGQTIRQENVFKNHSLFNANLVANKKYTSSNSSLISDALQAAKNRQGPVHINVPFEEPLYEREHINAIEVTQKPVSNNSDNQIERLEEYADIWNKAKKKMILIGASFPDRELEKELVHVATDDSVLVFTETTSNLHHKKFINSIDKLIIPMTDEDFVELQPEILLTLGGMVVSKKIKQVLRKYAPKHHWHIDSQNAADTYFCLSKHFKITPSVFFKDFNVLIRNNKSDYQSRFLKIFSNRKQKHNEYIAQSEFVDLKAFEKIITSIPKNAHLQFGNSSIIRYAQLFDLDKSNRVFCNRGTSGIDGSTSTAIGAASATINEQTIFITGDISFFYDSNALWNNYIPNSFRIILINNSGGGIFRFIEGPTNTDALDYFETSHNLNAKHLCEMFGFEYSAASNEKELIPKDFYKESDNPKLLEIFTPKVKNASILKNYFNYLK